MLRCLKADVGVVAVVDDEVDGWLVVSCSVTSSVLDCDGELSMVVRADCSKRKEGKNDQLLRLIKSDQ